MPTLALLDLPRRSAVWGYGIALLSVASALVSQHLMSLYWQHPARVSTFLVAVIISSWLGGARPGLLAAALSLMAFDYYYLGLPGSWSGAPSDLVRIVSFALVAGYVVWITATERDAAESLRRAHDRLQRNNEALRAENLERRRTEEQLRASEAKFRALSERAPAAIFTFHGGVLGYANPAAWAITGYTADELPGMQLRECSHAHFRDWLVAREQARQSGVTVSPSHELKVVTKAGEERWLDFTEGQYEHDSMPAVLSVALDVTERKRAEAALHRSERVLREAEELGHTGSWERDLTTGEIFNTPQNLRLFFGDDRNKDARYADYANAVHPDDRPYTNAYHRRLVEEGGPIEHEYRVIWPDGSVHTLFGRATVVRDASGRSVRAHGTNVDITERKRAEEAVRQSQQLLNLVIETLPVGVVVIDRAGDVILDNAASRRIRGEKRIDSGAERRMRSVRYWHDSGERIAPEDWPSVRALRDGKTTLNELIDVDTSDSRRLTIETSAAPIRDAAGSVVGAVVVLDDVTERKRTEEAVRQSQQLLNLVLETLPVGVAVMDGAGDIILSNAASRRIWGEKVIDSGAERWLRSAGYWHGSGQRVQSGQWPSVRALRDGQTTLNELIDIDAFDGRRKTIEVSAVPIRHAKESIVGAVIVIDEVTERVGAEEALHESANRLQQLSRRLLAVQEEERSHLSRELHDEFGQLLAATSLHLHAARGAAGQGAQRSLDEAMSLLKRAGAQLRMLALELRPRMLETAGLDSTLRWLAGEHQQHTGIATEVVGHVNGVSGDLAIACFRVVQEALTNVARHARAQRVRIELALNDGQLELSVHDDGVGFDVPGTLEGAAGRGNLGLVGMRERVEILGGTLELHSQPGQGTRIRIALPLVVSGTQSARTTA